MGALLSGDQSVAAVLLAVAVGALVFCALAARGRGLVALTGAHLVGYLALSVPAASHVVAEDCLPLSPWHMVTDPGALMAHAGAGLVTALLFAAAGSSAGRRLRLALERGLGLPDTGLVALPVWRSLLVFTRGRRIVGRLTVGTWAIRGPPSRFPTFATA